MSKKVACILSNLDRHSGFLGTLYYKFPDRFTSRLLGDTIIFELTREDGTGKLIAQYTPDKNYFRLFVTDDGVIEPELFKLVQRKLRIFGIEMRGLRRESKRNLGRLLAPTEIGRSP